jgi:hypothetical protein
LSSIREFSDDNEYWDICDGHPFICQRGDSAARRQAEAIGQMAENNVFDLDRGWNFVSCMVGDDGFCGWTIDACDLTVQSNMTARDRYNRRYGKRKPTVNDPFIVGNFDLILLHQNELWELMPEQSATSEPDAAENDDGIPF